MDIKIVNDEGVYKFRVCGIMEHNGKYLVVKMNDNPHFCLPGGHVEFGEDTEQAVEREMCEELGFPVKKKRLVAINQNFYKSNSGKPFHEIGFYYIVTAKKNKDIIAHDYEREELDKGKIQHLVFKWFTLAELKKQDFRPKFLVKCLGAKDITINITREK